MAYAVLTRDPADAQAYAAALAPLGFEVVAMPVTRTVPPADRDALARALAGDFAAIVIASPRAAHELARAGHTGAEIWAVGPATKRALDIAKLAAIEPGARDGAERARPLARQALAAVERILRRALLAARDRVERVGRDEVGAGAGPAARHAVARARREVDVRRERGRRHPAEHEQRAGILRGPAARETAAQAVGARVLDRRVVD